MKQYTTEEFKEIQKSDKFDIISFNAYVSTLTEIKNGIEKAETGDLQEEEVKEMHILKSDLDHFHPVKVMDNDFKETFLMVREKQVEFDNVEKGEFGEILKAEGGIYLNTDLNKALAREGADYDIMKAQGHKYFKREPKAGGGYKYYYTEAQYKKEKGTGEKKEGVWNKEQEKKIAENDKAFKEHLESKNIDPYSYEASKEWKGSKFQEKQKEILGKK